MPIAVRYVTTNPGRTAEFTFSGHKVLNYTVGIAYWEFKFTDGQDHFVRTIELDLVPNKVSEETIAVKVNGTFKDDSNHTLDTTKSLVVVCCIAVVDYANNQVTLASAEGINNGEQSNGITIPSGSIKIDAAFLSGWELTFNNDHQVSSIQLGTGAYENGNTAYIKATASMNDRSNNVATTARIDAGLLAATYSDDGVYTAYLREQQTTDTLSVDLKVPLSDAVVLLQNYQVTFWKNQDNNVKTVGGGCKMWTVEGSTVRLTSPRAFINDDVGNQETDGISNGSGVTLLVVGVPKPVAAS
ncbi:hypothetical protein [Vitiosangium sp. GDMCC 1.1324]|uniref:hypothetical protein n=1 Tax=Vitiosangium sp. (strain GDMCC 1.1324) TaxID=2138576 RepID=UPI000D352492|nr:hypothetical protein [Vitiosangium sp. GDMCC 1.1324]PTL75566.1 hypothetical protein DAT35_54095 [Vitiosangium sp. GDMCC 1.1324]